MKSIIPTRPRLARRARVRWDEREGRHLLVYPERGLLLNAVAARIVALCDGTRTVDEMLVVLSDEFTSAPRERIDEDTHAFLETLAERGLLAEGSP